jgi:hypothetical protein
VITRAECRVDLNILFIPLMVLLLLQVVVVVVVVIAVVVAVTNMFFSTLRVDASVNEV